MGFDDLARHMAARDKRTLSTGSADEIVVDAAKANRRMARSRDLILGPLLIVGGIVGCVFVFLLYKDALFPTPNRLRPPDTTRPLPLGLAVAALIMLGVGARQTIRGLRGRSS